jgi:dTDP-glucose pyrophosphorylase
MEKSQKSTKPINFKACILAAGIGSRNKYAKNFAKGLLPYKNKPLIFYILKTLPIEIEIIVAVGFQENLYREFLPMAFPERTFTFVTIDHYHGKKSGPGYSLLCCENFLKNPFYLFPSDAYIDPRESLPRKDYNWVGLGSTSKRRLSSYCLAEINQKGCINRFIDKESNPDSKLKDNVFTGIAFINNYLEFFEGLKSEDVINNEKQVSAGLNKLILKDLRAHSIASWKDLGTSSLYEINALDDEGQNLLKPNEKTYLLGNKVFKYFEDTEIISKKIKRANQLKPLTPHIVDKGKNFFSYKKVPGHLLSEEVSGLILENFLNKCKTTLFNPIEVNRKEKEFYYDQCLYFYKDLTLKRVENYLKKFPSHSESHVINGLKCPKFETIWNNIPWDQIREGIPSYFHGDFQPENIICSNNEIRLIDWRQNFTKETLYGDVYYDLAKLNHALIINGQMIREGHYSISISSNKVNYSYLMKSNLVNFLNIFNSFSIKNGYSIKKIDALTGIIYLRIASLYDTKYANFLYFLGIHYLSKRFL